MLPSGTEEPIVFLGGKDYLPLFERLTNDVRAPRTVFFDSANAPQFRAARAIRFSDDDAGKLAL